MRDTGALTLADFVDRGGERFQIGGGIEGDGVASFAAELVEATEIAREPGGRAPFSLVFQGGPRPPLPQRTYRVEHPELGVMELFLVPIGPDRYEAVFT